MGTGVACGFYTNDRERTRKSRFVALFSVCTKPLASPSGRGTSRREGERAVQTPRIETQFVQKIGAVSPLSPFGTALPEGEPRMGEPREQGAPRGRGDPRGLHSTDQQSDKSPFAEAFCNSAASKKAVAKFALPQPFEYIRHSSRSLL